MGYINVQRKAEEGPYSLAWDLDYWNFPNSTFDKVSGGLISWDDVGTSEYLNGQGIDYTLPTPIDMSQVQTSVVIECPVYYDRSSLQANYHELFALYNPDWTKGLNCFESPSDRCIQIDGVQTKTTSGGMAQGYSIQRVTITQSDVTWEQSVDNGTTWTTVYNISHDFSSDVFSFFCTLRRATERYTRRGVEYYKDWTIRVDGGENLLKLTEPYYITTRHYTASNSSCVTGGDVYCQTSSLYGTNVADTYIPFDTADNWEVRTKVNLDFSNVAHASPITGTSSSDWTNNPYLQVCYGWSSSGYPDFSLNLCCAFNSSGSSELNKCTSSNILSSGTTYYIKYGFTGTEYYIDVNTNGWNSTFTRWATVQDSTKCYCNSSYYLTFMNNITNIYTYGSMYMKDTCVYINGQKYWEAVTKNNGNSSTQAGNASLEDNNLSPGGWA